MQSSDDNHPAAVNLRSRIALIASILWLWRLVEVVEGYDIDQALRRGAGQQQGAQEHRPRRVLNNMRC